MSLINNVYRETSNSEEQLLSERKAKETLTTLRGLRSKHPKNDFLGHLNVITLRNKFESLDELIKDTFDVFLVSESKLDSSFSDSQFSIPDYYIVSEDRNKNRRGILFYIIKDIPFKVIESKQLRNFYQEI